MADRFGNIPIQRPKSPSFKKRDRKRTSATKSTGPVKKNTPLSVKVWGWAIGIVLLFALYSSVGFLGIPYYLTDIFPKNFNRQTGMTFEPTEIRFNPLTFRLETEKLKILSESGVVLMSLGSFKTDFAPLSLLRRDLVSNYVTIEALELNLTRELNGSYNFEKLLGERKTSDPANLMDFSDLPFFFSLNNIGIRNSKITFYDTPAEKKHRIEDIQLDLPSLSNIPFQADRYLRPRFSAIVNGSPVELTGHAGIGEAEDDKKEQATNLACDIHDLDLSLYADYLPFDLPFEINKGKADGELGLVFDSQARKGEQLSISFRLQLADTDLLNLEETVSVEIPLATISGQFQPVSKNLIFKNIALREPILKSYRNSLGKNISNLFPPAKTTAQLATSESTPFHLTTELFIVDDGVALLFKDKDTKKPTTGWKSLQANIKNYSTNKKDRGTKNYGTFRLSGEQMSNSSYFSWQGSFLSPRSLSGGLTLMKAPGENLLKALGKKVSFKIKGTGDVKGKLSVDIKNEISFAPAFTLSDADISLEGFKLISNNQTVLSSPLVKIAHLNLSDRKLHLGNVFCENGTAQFSKKMLPDFLKNLSNGSYTLQGIDYNGKLTLEHVKKSGRKLIISTFSAKAIELDKPETTKSNISISATTISGGKLKAQGKLSLLPFSLALTAEFSGLPAREVLGFYSTSSFINNIEANLDGRGIYTLPKNSFTGGLQLTNGSVLKGKDRVFSWEKSSFHEVHYRAAPFRLGIAQIDMDKANLDWHINKSDNGPMQQLAEFFRQNLPEVKESTNKKLVNNSAFEIQDVSISNSTIHIHDQRLKPSWQAEATEFAGTIKNIHSSGSKNSSDFNFNGRLDDSPFTIQGNSNLLSSTGNGKVLFSLENYPLASFHEQLTHNTDVDTSKGQFDLKVDSIWKDKEYHSTGSLHLIDIEPVSRSAESALPLALLTDPENNFSLDFEFSQTAPTAKTVLLEEILTLFQTLVVKGSLSPLLLASGDFTDLIGNEVIAFRPGEFMLSEQGRRTLTRYTALLIAHPHIGLELSGGVDSLLDKKAIQKRLEAIELKRVEDENEKLFKKWQKDKVYFENKLNEQQKEASQVGRMVELEMEGNVLLGFTPLQPEPIVVDDSMLLELAEKRQNVLKQHFTTQLALQSDRISNLPVTELTQATDQPANSVNIALKAVDR